MQPRYRKLSVNTLLAIATAMITACGGSSSGGGSEEVVDPGSASIESDDDPITPTIVSAAGCVEQLESIGGGNAFPTEFTDFDADCDYFVEGDINIVNDVIVEAGTTFVMAAGAQLTFRGTDSVVMAGTAERRIRFIGEDPGVGYWAGLDFNSVDEIELSYVDVIGGGGNDVSTNTDEDIERRAGIRIGNATAGILLSHITISSSAALGLLVTNSTLDLSENNRYFGNTLEGARFEGTNTSALDGSSDYSGGEQPNGRQFMDLATLGFSVSFGPQTRLVPLNVPYRSSGISVPEDTQLILEAGTTILFYEGEFADGPPRMGITGELFANGTEEAPVVLDLAPEQNIEHWAGLRASNGALNLEHVIVRRGGGFLEEDFPFGTFGSIIFASFERQATGSLFHVSIEDSASWGVNCSGQMPLVERFENVTFSDVEIGEVEDSCGI